MRQTPAVAAQRLRERLAEQWTESPTGCWLWTGTTGRDGYGKIGVKRADGTWRSLRAHRVSYEIHVGPIPDGLHLDHLCRNRRCVRPDHLEPVTNRVNSLRGAGACAVNAVKTHCRRGHEYTPANTITKLTKYGTPGRECRTCAELLRRRRSIAAMNVGEHRCPCGAAFREVRFLKMHRTKVHGSTALVWRVVNLEASA
jgi:hypothetical protein